MSAVDTAPRHRRRFALDPVRVIAALVVVATHVHVNQLIHTSAPTAFDLRLNTVLESLADTAVMLFFVLSAFVLYLPAVRATLSDRPPTTWKEMLLRRVVRLLPLYVVVVLVVWALTNHSLPGHWRDLVSHLTMTHVYSSQYIFWTDGPAWSLAVEFHFYVLMAFVTPVVSRWASRAATTTGRLARMAAFPLALFAVGALFLWWAVGRFEHQQWNVWFSPISMASIFAMGMLLAVAVAGGAELRHRVTRQAVVVASVALIAVIVAKNDPTSVVGEWWRIPMGLASVGLLASIVMSTGRTPRWLQWQPLVSLGSLSYGVYLLHEPIMRLLRHVGLLPGGDWGVAGYVVSTIAVMLASIIAARWSYRAIEMNAMRILASFEDGARLREYYQEAIDEADVPDHRVLVTR